MANVTAQRQECCVVFIDRTGQQVKPLKRLLLLLAGVNGSPSEQDRTNIGECCDCTRVP